MSQTTSTQERVPEKFDEVAGTYDLMVALNPGYHQQLLASARVLVAELPRPGDHGGDRPVRVADLGCGSGASTRALEKALREAGLTYELVGVDGSAGMLEQARAKQWRGQVHFAQDDAEDLDASRWGRAHLEGEQVLDGVFAAYLVRNVAARDALLAGVRRLLVPGGAVVLHEYSVSESRQARAVWDVVSWGVVVPLGLLTAPRSGIYRYLWRSVVDFDGASVLRGRMVAAGFEDVRSRSFGGWQRGVLHTFLGRRPRA